LETKSKAFHLCGDEAASVHETEVDWLVVSGPQLSGPKVIDVAILGAEKDILAINVVP
jgi:hypothetical protein